MFVMWCLHSLTATVSGVLWGVEGEPHLAVFPDPVYSGVVVCAAAWPWPCELKRYHPGPQFVSSTSLGFSFLVFFLFCFCFVEMGSHCVTLVGPKFTMQARLVSKTSLRKGWANREVCLLLLQRARVQSPGPT